MREATEWNQFGRIDFHPMALGERARRAENRIESKKGRKQTASKTMSDTEGIMTEGFNK